MEQTDRHNRSGAAETQPNSMIRVLVVDDHAVVREGLLMVLKRSPEIAVVGEAGDGKAALVEARRLNPDVVLMDVNMPGLNGLQATAALMAENNHVKVIGLSMYNDDEVATLMRQAGASAYLSKGCSTEELTRTIHNVVRDNGAAAAPRNDNAS
ncbi:response regulator transcription factor [Phycisphaerales bacterium AB-hyl4]|uniref:Response regulator transcription factor n=1 Tax=Natronomicrosphaera hydrolytica TaxID=3242702 RepID=A0ABV4UA82_9BACT